MPLPFHAVKHRKPYLDGPWFFELGARWPEPPTLAHPVGQLCTARQMEEPDFLRICGALRDSPRYHRKQWENAFIVRCLEIADMLGPGKKGVGFGVGRETLPAFFVSKGCEILATDMPAGEGSTGWAETNQHTQTLDGLFYQHLVTREAFEERTRFMPVDMNAVPDEIGGYDFCWSSCCLEHLGGLEEGWRFVEASLGTLRSGGVAVHTTEFNLSSGTDTLSSGPTVAYRERDLLDLVVRLRAAGHGCDLNLHPGDHVLDRFVDRYLHGDPTLRFYVSDTIVSTSVGLFIRKA